MNRKGHPKPGTILDRVQRMQVGDVKRIETSLSDHGAIVRQLSLPECERPKIMRGRRFLTRLCKETPVDGLGPTQYVMRITRVDDEPVPGAS